MRANDDPCLLTRHVLLPSMEHSVALKKEKCFPKNSRAQMRCMGPSDMHMRDVHMEGIWHSL